MLMADEEKLVHEGKWFLIKIRQFLSEFLDFNHFKAIDLFLNEFAILTVKIFQKFRRFSVFIKMIQ